MIQKAMAKKRSGEGGFTLVELLIVIVILGILAAIVVLAIGGLSDTASNAACNSGIKTLSSAEDAYFASPDAGDGTYGALADLKAEGLVKQKIADIPFTVVANGAVGYTFTGTGKCVGEDYTYPEA